MLFHILTYKRHTREAVSRKVLDLLSQEFHDVQFSALFVRTIKVLDQDISKAEKFLRRHDLVYRKEAEQ